MDRVKRIWYLSPMRAAKVQASLRIRAVSPEPPLLAHTSIESRGTFRQKARFLAPLNGWACAVKICHDGMLEDTNSLDGAQMTNSIVCEWLLRVIYWNLPSFEDVFPINSILMIKTKTKTKNKKKKKNFDARSNTIDIHFVQGIKGALKRDLLFTKMHPSIMVRLNRIQLIFEPRQANLCLRAFRHDKF